MKVCIPVPVLIAEARVLAETAIAAIVVVAVVPAIRRSDDGDDDDDDDDDGDDDVCNPVTLSNPSTCNDAQPKLAAKLAGTL